MTIATTICAARKCPSPPIPIRLMNMLNARHARRRAHVEGAVDCRRGRLPPRYTHFWKRFTFDPGSTDRTGGASEANDPGHLVKLRSYINARAALRSRHVFPLRRLAAGAARRRLRRDRCARGLSRAPGLGYCLRSAPTCCRPVISSSAPAPRRSSTSGRSRCDRHGASEPARARGAARRHRRVAMVCALRGMAQTPRARRQHAAARRRSQGGLPL